MTVSPPPSSDVNRVADWIELFVLVNNSPISKSKIISNLQNSLTIDEDDVDSALLELERRLLLYGKVKPFEVQKSIVIPKIEWEEFPEYILCLYYSTYGVGTVKKGAKRDNGTKLFEDITKECLELFFQTSGHLFGFPNTLSFKQQLDNFAKIINEKRFEDPMPHDKDRDVDLIIFKRFDEVRDNSMLFFVQCAAGKNWDDKKAVATESYRRYMSLSLKSHVSSLAITQIVDINDWRNACDDYGIVIDRARLYQIFSPDKGAISKGLKDTIIKWCKSKLN